MKKITYIISLVILISAGVISMTARAVAETTNLISNYSVEDSTSTGIPTDWNKGGYGTNVRTLTYPVSGYNSSKAIKVDISSYTSGDAKWYFSDIPVTAGATYDFSDYYISNILSYVDIRFTLNDGSYKYGEIATAEANPDTTFKKVSAQFVAPANAVSVTIFHLINNVGYLIMDEFSISKVEEIVPEPPVDTTNLISNPDFEQAGSNGAPLSWSKGGYGTNSRTLSYPVTSSDGSKAVMTKITSYTSGDAKWYFTPVTVPAGDYTYSDNYKSDINSIITVQYQNSDNSYTYKDIAWLTPASTFATSSVTFSVPVGTKNITIFHLIEEVGTLTIDNVALREKQDTTATTTDDIFSTGAITFRFDDGWLSTYENAVPKLAEAGFTGTFYIVSQRLLEDGYSGFINHEQLTDLYNQGFEIGAHTRTHPYLTELSPEEQEAEIRGSKEDLLALGITEVNSFSYPFGEYTDATVQLVKDTGFTNAVSVTNGYNTESVDKFLIKRKSVVVTTKVADIKTMIDTALKNKTWLILELHEINNSGNTYSMTQNNFDQVVDYAVAKGIRAVTVSEGVKSL